MLNKKSLFLFLGLVLPVLIFIFLKMFGKNEFDVPLIYGEGVPERPNGCNFEYGTPYVLPDSITNRFKQGKMPALLLLNFSAESSILNKIVNNFASDSVALVNIADTSQATDNLKNIKQCMLLIKQPTDIVMIDRNRNIRGYYEGRNRDELDRLQDEIAIILKKY